MFRSFTILTIAVLISLIASSLMTVGVIADDATPPSEEQETSQPEEIIPEGIIEETNLETVGEIIEQLPENTNLVITTPQGIEPLATTLAANIVLIGDPIWCPDGVPPIPGVGGCSTSYTSLSQLVYNITEPTANGTIWITSGTDLSASFVSIDGSSFVNWSNYNLTIQGGWNGDNLGTINSTTTLSTPIEVVNWSGNVTINDLIANSVGSTALAIDTSGDISLNNLTANNNNFVGISASAGGSITAQNITTDNNGTTGPSYGYGAEFSGSEITLTGTNQFSGNGESGLYVTSTGNISINNLTADGNGVGGTYGSGAEIESTNGTVTLTGTNQFNNNNNSGLIIEANGIISTENITANNNNVGVEIISGSDGVTLSGTNQFNNNDDIGLYVESINTISAENITANNNGSTGTEFYSTLGGVNLTGTNQFNNNFGSGLYIDVDGAIDIENVTANSNGTSTLYGGGAELLGSSLNIDGINQFNGNTESGIYANIDGNITLANIVASGNGSNGGYGVGAELVSGGSVDIIGNNVFSQNNSGGLAIDAATTITILNSDVIDNYDTGVYLSALGDITLNCVKVTGNDGVGLDANASNLYLYGTEIDQNFDDEILSALNIFYTSNSCFTYPVPPPPEPQEPLPTPDVNVVRVVSGETALLDCSNFDVTILYLPKGDGASLPCGFGDSARLIEMYPNLVPNTLPRDNTFISSFDLVLEKDGQPIPLFGDNNSLWYWEVVYDPIQDRDFRKAYFWDGTQWVESHITTLPFVRVFFLVPNELKNSNLAILYWDGINWVELSDEQNLDQGKFVVEGGRFDGNYFEAEVNFVGIFTLVEKQ